MHTARCKQNKPHHRSMFSVRLIPGSRGASSPSPSSGSRIWRVVGVSGRACQGGHPANSVWCDQLRALDAAAHTLLFPLESRAANGRHVTMKGNVDEPAVVEPARVVAHLGVGECNARWGVAAVERHRCSLAATATRPGQQRSNERQAVMQIDFLLRYRCCLPRRRAITRARAANGVPPPSLNRRSR